MKRKLMRSVENNISTYKKSELVVKANGNFRSYSSD